MQYAETLREVKKAEAEVRDLKADAQRQATQHLRDAERQANALLETARKEADAAYAATLEAARQKAEKDRKTRLAAGEKDAATVRGRTSGPEFKGAVDTLLANFEHHVTGK
jgi:vacuolar-type H+-ATPase subunit H